MVLIVTTWRPHKLTIIPVVAFRPEGHPEFRWVRRIKSNRFLIIEVDVSTESGSGRHTMDSGIIRRRWRQYEGWIMLANNVYGAAPLGCVKIPPTRFEGTLSEETVLFSRYVQNVIGPFVEQELPKEYTNCPVCHQRGYGEPLAMDNTCGHLYHTRCGGRILKGCPVCSGWCKINVKDAKKHARLLNTVGGSLIEQNWFFDCNVADTARFA